jgi:hypothetical protein
MTISMEDSMLPMTDRWRRRAILDVLGILTAVTLAGIYAASAAEPANVKELVAANFPARPDCKGPRTLVIASNADWKRINDSQFDVFCVRPGDYSSSGGIVIRQSGSAATPKWLLLNDPATPKDETHPVKLPPEQRATLKELNMDGAKHWVVDRIAINSSVDSNQITNGAENVTWNRLLVEKVSMAAAVVLSLGVRNITVQNSVVRNMVPKPGVDLGCIYHERDTDTKILNNELYNCASNGIQLGGAGSTGTIVVENNDVYLTSRLYCNAESGILDPSGIEAANEDGYVLKGPASGATVFIRNNRFWGFRHSASRCGTTSDVPASGVNLGSGNTVVSNVHVQSNIFDDIQDWGVYVSNRVEDFTISNNIMLSGVRVPIQNLYAHRFDIFGNRNILRSVTNPFCYERKQWTGPELRCVPSAQQKDG